MVLPLGAFVRRVVEEAVKWWSIRAPGGGRPLGSGRQLPPQLTVGRRPLGGGGGGGMGGGGGSGRVGWGGGPGRTIWGVGGGGGTGSPYLPLPSL